MPLSVAIEMGKLVQQNTSLQKIYVIEGHWFFQFVLRCIFPFLNSKMRDKFVVVNGSLLEVVAYFRDLGLSLQHLEALRTRFG